MKQQLQNALASAQSVLVVTGAGISVASGISPFRGSDPDAVWNNDILEKGTIRYFLTDTVDSWQWYLSRFDGIVDKEPNDAHHALVQLEKWAGKTKKDFMLLTQNIDCLHRKAGSQRITEVHGRADRLRCVQFGCQNASPGGSVARTSVDFSPFRDAPNGKTLPRCELCGGLIRPHVLWFDEYYTEHVDYAYNQAMRFWTKADIAIFIGTSFSVGITDSIYRDHLYRGVKMWSIDPFSQPEYPNINWIQEKAEVFLPDLVAQLGE